MRQCVYFSHLLLNFYYKFLHDDGKGTFFCLLFFSATADVDSDGNSDGDGDGDGDVIGEAE